MQYTLRSTGAIMLAGLLTTLAAADEPSPQAVLRGRMRMLRAEVDRAFEHIEQGRRNECLQACRRMAAAYVGVSGSMEERFREIGSSRTQIELGLAIVRELETGDVEKGLIRQRLGHLTKDARACRSQLIVRVGELRREYQAAADDAAHRRRVADAMAVVLERVEHLDSLIRSGESAAEGGLSAVELAEPLKALREQIAQEEQVLRQQARTTVELVAGCMRDLNRSLEYLRVTESLPAAQVERLRDSRRAMQDVLDELEQTRTATARAVEQARRERTPVKRKAKDKELIRQAERLLKHAAPQADAERQDAS